jgi:hypothetical protein
MTAMLRTQPASLRKAVVQIRSENAASKTLLNALASANSPQAQSALVALANDEKLSKRRRTAAASSLLRVQEPSPEMIEALETWLSSELLFTHGCYGLGTVARKLRERGQVDESNRLSKLLMDRLGTATSPQDQAIVLRGIANSAYLGAVGLVRPFLDDEDSSLRLASVQALRLMQSPAVDALIAARLTSEKMAKVRQAIVSDLGRRPPSPVLVEATRTLALESAERQHRLEAVQLLGGWASKLPEVTTTLERISVDDADEKVRAAAAKVLDK